MIINAAGLKFFDNIPISKRSHYAISYDFFLIQKDHIRLLVYHILTPLELDKGSNIWPALCIISLAANDTAGNITIRKKNENKLYRYDIFVKGWKKEDIPGLSNKEKEIVLLAGQVLTMENIASLLYIRIDTIKFH